MNGPLATLAARVGIADAYHDIWGKRHETSDATRAALLTAMHLDPENPGRLAEEPSAAAAFDAPSRCYLPAVLARGGRVWGLTAQLYGVRSQRNWGIGDFTDLAVLLEFVAAAGGDFVGLNPLHALFPDNPAHISPYSPSHRGFLNALAIDVEAVPEFAACAAVRRRIASADFQARLATLRATELVDYPAVAALKFSVLRELFAHFRTAGGARAAQFTAWRTAQGDGLERFARFEALQAHFRAADARVWGWPVWPAAYRDPASPAVAAFAAAHAEEIAWHAWLQWIADQQLAACAARARDLDMAIGVYRDLAVGANPGGAEVWSAQEVFANGAHAGAPPDEINLMGQDWGLPPFVPHRLAGADFAPFAAILSANMRHAGALRIDHVMGLMRLFWVPAGQPASEGAYVAYPFEAMLGCVTRASQAAACLVIGEDLGTVPEGFRERLAEAALFSYRPLIFERSPDGQFRLPGEMPAQALVAVSTHDLPTLAGFWNGEDIRERARLALFPDEAMRQRIVTERDWDRGRLLWALEREGLLPTSVSKEAAAMPEISLETVAAVHAYLARARAQLCAIQAEDLLGMSKQANLPGTLEHQHPNWQRKLSLPLEDWPGDRRVGAILEAVRRERPRPG